MTPSLPDPAYGAFGCADEATPLLAMRPVAPIVVRWRFALRADLKLPTPPSLCAFRKLFRSGRVLRVRC